MRRNNEDAVREAMHWLGASDENVRSTAEALGMDESELRIASRSRVRAWVMVEMTRRVTVREWASFHVNQVLPEWSERWGSWPHCNGQAGCWMHVSVERGRWCGCACWWCRVARAVRRDGKRCGCDGPGAAYDYSEIEWTCPHGVRFEWDDGEWFRG